MRRPRWRKMTWVVVVWSVLMAVSIIAAIVSADPSSHCAHPGALSKATCEDASNAGAGVGVAALWFIWFFGFIALSLIWFMTRPKGRECPACGERVKRGLTRCGSCGHDFTVVAASRPAGG